MPAGSLEELAPQIREELGPSAVILNQRQDPNGRRGRLLRHEVDRGAGRRSRADARADRGHARGQRAAAEAAPAPAPQPQSTIDDERAALVADGARRGARTTDARRAGGGGLLGVAVEELALPDFAGSIGPRRAAIVTPAASPAAAEQAIAHVVPPVRSSPTRPSRSSSSIARPTRDAPRPAARRPRPRWRTTVDARGVRGPRRARPRGRRRRHRERARRRRPSARCARSIRGAAARPRPRRASRRDPRVEQGWAGDGSADASPSSAPRGVGKTTARAEARRALRRGRALGRRGRARPGTRHARLGAARSGGRRARRRRAPSTSRRAGGVARGAARPSARFADQRRRAHRHARHSRSATRRAARRCGRCSRALRSDELHAAVPLGFAERECRMLLGRARRAWAPTGCSSTKTDEARFAGPLVTPRGPLELPLVVPRHAAPASPATSMPRTGDRSPSASCRSSSRGSERMSTPPNPSPSTSAPAIAGDRRADQGDRRPARLRGRLPRDASARGAAMTGSVIHGLIGALLLLGSRGWSRSGPRARDDDLRNVAGAAPPVRGARRGGEAPGRRGSAGAGHAAAAAGSARDARPRADGADLSR